MSRRREKWRDLDQETAHKLVRYDPATGVLYWKERTPDLIKNGSHLRTRDWNNRFAGRPALDTPDSFGHKRGTIFNKIVKAHQIIWLLFNGYMPTFIDHINGDPKDNRIENLREANYLENSRNQRRAKNNKSGVTGVCWDKVYKSWKAYIKVEGKTICLGRKYANVEDAAKARRDAEIKYGFHPNHGKSREEINNEENSILT